MHVHSSLSILELHPDQVHTHAFLKPAYVLLFNVLLPSHRSVHMRDRFNYKVLDISVWMFWRGLGGILATSQKLHDPARLDRHCNNVLVDDIDSRSFQLSQQGACDVGQAHILHFLCHCLLATNRRSDLDCNSGGQALSLALHNYLALL